VTTGPVAELGQTAADPAWDRYGRAIVRGMAEVLAEAPEAVHTLLLETADYWLSVGLAIGAEDRAAADRLLRLIEAEDRGQAELTADATAFVTEALG